MIPWLACHLLGVSVAAADWNFASENDFILQNAKVNDSVINPKNQILQVPDASATADLRPQIKWSDDEQSFLIRPRWVGQAFTWQEGDPSRRTSDAEGRWNLTDAYYHAALNSRWQINAGLEVYEWGPAELYNASNPYFHLYTNSRSAFFKEKGLGLARVIFDQNSDTNYMVILNPASNLEPSFRAEQEFRASGIGKAEWKFAGGRRYLGLLAGTDPDQDPVVGLYANATSDTGWSVYFDGKVLARDRSFQPVVTDGSPLILSQSTQDRTTGIGILGLRHEGEEDWRLEFLYNHSGYDRSQLLDVLSSFQTPNVWTSLNAARFARSGLELIGQEYLYASARFPNLGKRKEDTFFLAEILSLDDDSGLTQANFEVPWGNSVLLEFEGSLFLGPNKSEFTLLDEYQILLGCKWLL